MANINLIQEAIAGQSAPRSTLKEARTGGRGTGPQRFRWRKRMQTSIALRLKHPGYRTPDNHYFQSGIHRKNHTTTLSFSFGVVPGFHYKQPTPRVESRWIKNKSPSRPTPRNTGLSVPRPPPWGTVTVTGSRSTANSAAGPVRNSGTPATRSIPNTPNCEIDGRASLSVATRWSSPSIDAEHPPRQTHRPDQPSCTPQHQP